MRHWLHLLAPLISTFHSFLPLIIGGGGALGGPALAQWYRQRRAAMWPSADGEVQHVEVRPGHGYTVQVDYRYYARREYRYGKYFRRFHSKADARQFADFLHGRHIQVRFQEDRPQVSVVLDQDLHMIGALQMG